MILVTGATGFVGRHLVARYQQEKRPLRLLSRSPAPTPSDPLTEWIRGDLNDASTLHAALDGVRTVIHAAATLGAARNAADMSKINVEGTANIARAARAAGVAHFIHISSAGVYGDGHTFDAFRETDEPRPGNVYEQSKLDSEWAVRNALASSDVSWTILRPTGLYGADRDATTQFYQSVARRRVWVHGFSHVIVHPTHIGDLVQAVSAVVARPALRDSTINVAGDRAIELSSLIALVGGEMGHAPVQLRMPRWSAGVARSLASTAAALGAPSARLQAATRRITNRSASIDLARELLSYTPSSLEENVRAIARVIRKV